MQDNVIFCQGTVLCESPLIIYSSQYSAKFAAVNVLPSHIGETEAIFLVMTAWTHENPGQVAAAKNFVEAHRARHPKHRVILLTNTENERLCLRSAGLEAEHFNHNIFVSKDLYYPIIGAQRRYSAVYNVRIPTKPARHSDMKPATDSDLKPARVPI